MTRPRLSDALRTQWGFAILAFVLLCLAVFA